ncbi:MAG: hypothetical protein H6779_02075 [Candidatus Nomurabacteria bacterium]|nr:hypothetical protein [Candidatus Nomurabacteria bacterium]USN88212.1 MAG: hypothetical protein H6779_02075 [Candidatus Nomurabacteria bacterium]
MKTIVAALSAIVMVVTVAFLAGTPEPVNLLAVIAAVSSFFIGLAALSRSLPG